uniref:Uncharacterized protein n=1 Tax=Strongyloides stercoralis TaxID=6248 RepID=A0AAF5HYW0_STRER
AKKRTLHNTLSTIGEESRSNYSESTTKSTVLSQKNSNKTIKDYSNSVKTEDEESIESSISSLKSNNSYIRINDNYKEVLKSIEELRNVSLNNSECIKNSISNEGLEQKFTNDTINNNDKKINSDTDNQKENLSLEEIAKTLLQVINENVQKSSVQKNEVSLSQVKSIKLINNIANDTTKILEKDKKYFVNSTTGSDFHLSLDEDDLIDKPIQSNEMELVSSGEVDLIPSKNSKPIDLSTIHEESKDMSNNHSFENRTLDSNLLDEMYENSCKQSIINSNASSLVDSVGGSYSKKSKTPSNLSEGRSLISDGTSILSDTSRNSEKRIEEKHRNVMESIDMLRNISSNNSIHLQRPDSRETNASEQSIYMDDGFQSNRVKFNPIHQSVSSSFFHHNTPTSSKSTNYDSKKKEKDGQNENVSEEKNTSLDQLQDMLINLKKSSVEVEVNKDEVPLSEMKSFKFLNDIIERTTSVFLKDHFDYLNENQAFFEMSPGFLAQYIPETIDEKCLDKSKVGSRIFGEINNEQPISEDKMFVELTGRNTSNQMEGSCNVKSVDSGAFFANNNNQ